MMGFPMQVRDDGRYGTLYITADNAPLLASAPDEPVVHMARFLPYEDAIVKAYKETRFRFFGDKESWYVLRFLFIVGFVSLFCWSVW